MGLNSSKSHKFVQNSHECIDDRLNKGATNGRVHWSSSAGLRDYTSMGVRCLTACRVVLPSMQWFALRLRLLRTSCLGSSVFSKLQNHENSKR